jgi:transcriptional regulator of acetoin/glycerol metabolism
MPLKLLRTDLPVIKTLRDAEHEQVVLALRALNGNITEAAEILGVSRATLYRKVKNHGLLPKVLEFRGKEACGQTLVHE